MLRGEERMSDLDALFWAVEASRRGMTCAMTLVAVLDGCPDRELLENIVEGVARRVPRLRCRADGGLLPMVPPRWQPDPAFDMGHHLRFGRVSGRGALEDLLDLAAPIAEAPLDRSKPLWDMEIVEGLEAGRSAMVVRLHHTYTDGLGALQLASELFDLQPERTLRPAPGAPASPPPSSAKGLWQDLAFEWQRGRATAGRLASWTAAAVRDAVVDPVERARAVRDVASAARSMAQSAVRPGSDVMTARSRLVRLGCVEVGLPEMKARAHACGATVNDVFLAGVLGGMRLYHAKHGSGSRSLRLVVPVSTRESGDEPALGNRVDGFVLRAPLTLSDPIERIRLLHEMVLVNRRLPLRGLLPDLAAAALHVPGFSDLVAASAGAVDLVTSNVPGSPVPLYLAGCRVERFVPFGPRGGAALNLTLGSYADRVAVGVNIDTAAVTDEGVMLDCLRAGFDEVLS